LPIKNFVYYREGWGRERAGVVTKHNLENLATPKLGDSGVSQKSAVWIHRPYGIGAVNAPRAQPREAGGKRRRPRRIRARGGRGSLVKGFLRPESPRMQGKQEVGLVMCVISTL